MAVRGSSIIRHSLDQPKATLSYLCPDEQPENVNKAESWKKDQQETVKTEKSVHFATEYESVSEAESTPDSLKTSRDVYTMLPSENLYSGDTFFSETQTAVAADSTDATSNPTEPSYTNTFIALESEDETRTASDISHTESFASSTVFSQADSDGSSSSSGSGSAHREWKDVTDIVKDINELEESEFVTKQESVFSSDNDEQATDVTESDDEEMAAIQRDHFLLSTIRRLRLQDVLSPRSLTTDVHTYTHSDSDLMEKKKTSPEESAFCNQMIKFCKKPKANQRQDTEVNKPKQPVLESYGLSSSLVDRLHLQNLQQRLAKKAAEIEMSTQESLQVIQERQNVETEILRQKFISQVMAQVQNENTEERIQAHLIKMHPVKHFAEFVNGLPKMDENSREILYKYKRRLEAQRDNS
ncbi:hypothetical protein PoB_002625400 [Plakobranchus ocellatus]|uniref:Uncharacterized protein n=1 Tax=Plakobranchus ocellatus TaxID=259542 RepID=A0AAV3ZWQ1_9GAST|nr:hypothetical protein PoB_002625400 [Plakobranchus ocellatus]